MVISVVRPKDSRPSNVIDFPVTESLALGYLTSFLRNSGIETQIIDEEVQRTERSETLSKLIDSEVIGFTATAKPQIYGVMEIVKQLKERGCRAHMTVGGQFATFMDEQLLSLDIFDSVVRFEGEETFRDLVRTIQSGRDLSQVQSLSYKKDGRLMRNPIRPLIQNLDDLPFPARDLTGDILKNGGIATISTSRGCYNGCSYCSIFSFYRTPKGNSFRLRSAQNVGLELEELKARFPKLKKVWIVDDNFVTKGEEGFQRTVKLCDALQRTGILFDTYLRATDATEKNLRELKRAGLESLFIGIESACDNTLRNIYNKRTTVEQNRKAIELSKELGIRVETGFIMFHPWSTMDEVGQNITFLEQTEQYPPSAFSSFLTAYRFTPIGKRMLSGELHYTSRTDLKEDTLRDDVPYEVQDKRAEYLRAATLEAFRYFHDLPRALSQLKSFARITNNSELHKYHEKEVNEYCLVSMHYFKALYQRLKQPSLANFQDFFEGICQEIDSESRKQISDINAKLAQYTKEERK